ncbi:MAG: hypothetical protein ACJA19_000898 [Bacteroidia bacterium]
MSDTFKGKYEVFFEKIGKDPLEHIPISEDDTNEPY